MKKLTINEIIENQQKDLLQEPDEKIKVFRMTRKLIKK
jgi:hypothetical protein